jgi:hypothetical protein
MIDFETTLLRTQPVVPDLERLRGIEGWLCDEAIDFTSRVAHLQQALGHAGGVLELGVFKGKYLALLSALYQDRGPVVGVDGFLASVGTPLEPRWRALAEQNIRDNVALLTGSEHTLTLIGGFTRDVDVSEIVAICPGGFGFISVDAGHEAADLIVDLGIATATAAASAVIALDDVFNLVVPGVADGVCRFFYDHPDCPFRPFAICGNKVFLCHTNLHEIYLAYAKWILSTESSAVYIAKSVALYKQNQDNNFVPRFLGHEVVVFVWN